MILKVLLVVIVIAVVYFLFIKKKPIQNNKNKKNNQTPKSNEMVECAACGTYASLDESIISNNKYYCSQECVDKV